MLCLTTFLFSIARLHYVRCQTASPSSAASVSSVDDDRSSSYVIHNFNVDKSLELQQTSANTPTLLQWKQGFNLTFSTSDANFSAAPIECSLHDAWSPEGNADDGQKAIASSPMSCNESAVNVTIQRDKTSPEKGFYLFLDTENMSGQSTSAVWTVSDLANDTTNWEKQTWRAKPEIRDDSIWHSVYSWIGGAVKVGGPSEQQMTVPIVEWLRLGSG